MFYETNISTIFNYFRFGYNQNFSYPSHMHSSFEFLLVLFGSMEITVNKKSWLLHKNEAVLVFPNQIHSFKNVGNCEHIYCIFSKELVSFFSQKKQNTFPESNFFVITPELREMILHLQNEKSTEIIKGTLYLLCGEFDKQAVYTSFKKDKQGLLIHKIFDFIEEHFNQDCSLMALEKQLHYSYVYLSRFFKNHCGISYNDYVNFRRINEACHLLNTTDKSILAISEEVGYTSVSTFNRNFKKIIGTAPTTYNCNGYISTEL